MPQSHDVPPVHRTLAIALLALLTLTISLTARPGVAEASGGVEPLPATPDLVLTAAEVRFDADLDLLVFEQQVEGRAGGTTPEAAGRLHGAPVVGHVFPTSLAPGDVGFAGAEGIVALAVTTHPDFDDTPLWDENGDRDYTNDGLELHTHWVLLGKDDRVPGGLAVVEFRKEDSSIVLPPTNPGMAMFMDSPGFSVVTRGRALRVLVPAARVNHKLDFTYDAVTAYMEVNTEMADRPLLGVYAVYSVLSGDLSLPYRVKR